MLISTTSILCMASLALLVALGVDRFLGEPRSAWHPVVWMGNYLTWAGDRIQHVALQTAPYAQRGQPGSRADGKAFLIGTVAWMVGALVVVLVAGGLQMALLNLLDVLALQSLLLGLLVVAVVMGVLLKPMMAWRMLRDEALAVEHALSAAPDGSLQRGRERLSWLVSRDVSQLTEVQVRQSVIESLAENFNDSVIAPLFWFALLGLPGAALYRFANTADAMWGYPGVYHGRNWQWAGKLAARADDVLSWVPARLTALLFAVAAGGISPARLRAQAARTPSPNSGWPMAAMALALDVALEKPEVYVLNPAGRPVQCQDLQQALGLTGRALQVFVPLAMLAVFWPAVLWA